MSWPQPSLVSCLLKCYPVHVLANTDAGIRIRYRTDGRFFDLRCLKLKANTKVRKALIRDFVFADDCALAAHSESELQCLATCFSTAAKAFGLTVSIQISVVMHQPAPATCGTEPSISIDDATLKNVENFTYLGSCLSSDASLDKEIAIRLSKASNSSGRMCSRVCNERDLKEETKIAVYSAVVLSSLLYGCESWTCYRRHHKKLDQFHLRCLRKILGITWMDKVSNQDVLRRANSPGVEALITKAQLRWSGHLMLMEDSRLFCACADI